VIFKYQGTLDKFVGDEIIALFGAPVAMESAEVKAVQCALDMMQVLSEFNRVRVSEGQNEIKIGIGINTGMVVTGAIGSSRALQYTAIRRRHEHDGAPGAASLSPARSSSPRRRSGRSRARSPPCRCPTCASRASPRSCAIYNAVGVRDRSIRDKTGESTRPG